MSRKSDKTPGERTFDTVRARYQGWFGEGRRSLPGREVSDGSEYWDETSRSGGGEMSRMVMMGIGGVLGLGLLVLAGLSFANAASWADVGRDGAQVGYAVVGVFLTIAGLGAILATWNHNFRVAGRPAHH